MQVQQIFMIRVLLVLYGGGGRTLPLQIATYEVGADVFPSRHSNEGQVTKRLFVASPPEPPVGIEPTTFGLQNRCSAN